MRVDFKYKNHLLIATICIATIAASYMYYLHRSMTFTENAYVQGNKIPIVSQTSGFVAQVYIHDTLQVSAGDVLFSLDDTDAKMVLVEAEQNLIQTIRETDALFSKVEALQKSKYLAKANLDLAKKDYQSRVLLAKSAAISQEELRHAKTAFENTKNLFLIASHKYDALAANTTGTQLATHPLVENAKQKVRQAWINLQRCQVRAPMGGMIAKHRVQVGSPVSPGTPLGYIIPLDQLWVNANFKETQLAHLKKNQKVTLTSDFWGSSVVFHGCIQGIAAGTGSSFSLLPPQNATGNWIKIVQRVPTKILLDPDEMKQHPLRVGLSMHVTALPYDHTYDHTSADNKMVETPPIQKTSIYKENVSGAEQHIEKILSEQFRLLHQHTVDNEHEQLYPLDSIDHDDVETFETW